MQIQSFVGGSNVLQSSLADCELSINFRQESTQSSGAKVQRYLQRTPGLKFRFSVGSDPVRALYSLNGRGFGVSGTMFFEVIHATNVGDPDTYIVRGTVAAESDLFPSASICSNGPQGD